MLVVRRTGQDVDWTEGRDVTNPTSNTATTTEAGAFQVSANSMSFGPELKALVIAHAGAHPDRLVEHLALQVGEAAARAERADVVTRS